jgi:hypothetical protein
VQKINNNGREKIGDAEFGGSDGGVWCPFVELEMGKWEALPTSESDRSECSACSARDAKKELPDRAAFGLFQRAGKFGLSIHPATTPEVLVVEKPKVEKENSKLGNGL